VSIDLSALKYRTAKPRYLDYGGELVPALGGPIQRINRLGNRFALQVHLKTVPEEPDGRIIAQMLRLAKQQGAMFRWPQPGLQIGAPGSPVVDGAVSGGTSLPIRGATPHYAIRFGQAVSIIHGGRRYLATATAPTIVGADGRATVPIDPMLRTALSDGDTVEIAKPMIEGLLDSGDLEWEIMGSPFSSYSFTIREQK
jgi:hypothetical protein